MTALDSQSPVFLPSMRAGETDGRYLDCTLDLGEAADLFSVPPTVTIIRKDGAAITSSDLAVDGSIATTLDATGLIPTFWLIAPAAAAGVDYIVTISGGTASGRQFIRDAYLSVLALMG